MPHLFLLGDQRYWSVHVKAEAHPDASAGMSLGWSREDPINSSYAHWRIFLSLAP